MSVSFIYIIILIIKIIISNGSSNSSSESISSSCHYYHICNRNKIAIPDILFTALRACLLQATALENCRYELFELLSLCLHHELQIEA
jgi:hypothetical protein